MILNRRERIIGFLTLSAVLLLGLDQLYLSPMQKRKLNLDTEIANARQALIREQGTITSSRRIGDAWKQMRSTAIRRDSSEAESQVLNSVRDFAQEAGLALSSVKPERSEKEKGFERISFRATGAGTMSQIGHFLWRIQTASIPIRVNDVVINSRRDGTDDLSVTLGISTICMSAEADRSPRASASLNQELP